MAHRLMDLEPVPVEKVVAGFNKAVAADRAWNAQQKAAVAKRLVDFKDDPLELAETIPLALGERYPQFKKAMTAFANEAFAESQPDFEKLAAADAAPKDPYLKAYARFFLGRGHVLQERYEDAAPLLRGLTKEDLKYLAHAGDALFMLGVSEARMLKRNVADAILDRYLKLFPDAPERMQIGATQMLAELRRLQEGSILDVHAHMDDARRRLSHEQTHKPTQEAQDKVIAMLDRLIEEAEQQQPPPGGGGGGGGGGGQQPGPPGPPSGTPLPGNAASPRPAADEVKLPPTPIGSPTAERPIPTSRIPIVSAINVRFIRRPPYPPPVNIDSSSPRKIPDTRAAAVDPSSRARRTRQGRPARRPRHCDRRRRVAAVPICPSDLHGPTSVDLIGPADIVAL